MISSIPSSVSDAFGIKSDITTASIVANGIGGFYSDVKIQEQQTYESTVPDFPVEDGSFIQDHIIHKPIIIKITGVVMPIHFVQQKEKFSSTPSQMLDTLSVLLPKKTAFQLQQIRNHTVNAIDTVDGYLSGFDNIFYKFKGDKKDLMKIFHDFLLEIRIKKMLIDINMPFKTHKNMALTSFVFTTDNEANSLGYELFAKNIIIAESKFTENVFKKGVRVENNGILEPQDVSLDVCKNILPCQ